MRARRTIAFGAAALALALPAPAVAKTIFPGVHAHRGGPNTGGVAALPENSLEAFRASHGRGADVIELDAKLTSDGVPVVMHDATLDRTTNCSGQVNQKTAAEVAACRIDTVGTADKIRPADGPGVEVPTLADVLAWARADRAKLNLEIKNQPTDPDYDSGSGFATAVLTAVETSGIPKHTVLIQSFWPPNLDVARARGFLTSLLLLQQGSNQGGIDLARMNQYDIVSPGWPTAGDPEDFVERAHAAGKPVVPYTIDTETEIRRAFDVGVDGVITNDTELGLKVRYGPLCDQAVAREKRLRAKYRSRLAAYRARRTAARRKSTLSARRAYNRARRGRATTCAKAGE